jgi:hypothetical protein
VGKALNWHGHPYEQLQLANSLALISQGVIGFSFVLAGYSISRIAKVSVVRNGKNLRFFSSQCIANLKALETTLSSNPVDHCQPACLN